MLEKILKNKNIMIVVLGVLIGGALIIYGEMNNDKKFDIPEPANVYSSTELDIYTDNLEKKITGFIEKIGGVSNVAALVTIESSKENIYATEGGNLDYVILTDSSGNQGAVKLAEINTTVRGIAIVCDYQNEEIKQQIISMLSSLFNIGTNRISVISAS